MRRIACMSLLTLLGLVLVVGTYDAAQEPHPPIEVLPISDNLFVLGSGRDDRWERRGVHHRPGSRAHRHERTRVTAQTSSGTSNVSPTSR